MAIAEPLWRGTISRADRYSIKHVGLSLVLIGFGVCFLSNGCDYFAMAQSPADDTAALPSLWTTHHLRALPAARAWRHLQPRWPWISGPSIENSGAAARRLAPPIDPNKVTYMYFRVYGGEGASPAALAPKTSPLGVAPKKVNDEIIKATVKEWKGKKVTVRVRVQNRVVTVEVLPSASSLLIKALKEPERDRKKVKHIKHDGKLTMEQIIEVAQIMRGTYHGQLSEAHELAGTIREVIGTAKSIGATLPEGVEEYKVPTKTTGLEKILDVIRKDGDKKGLMLTRSGPYMSVVAKPE